MGECIKKGLFDAWWYCSYASTVFDFFFFFVLPEFGENHLCSHRQPQFWSFLLLSLTKKCVDRNTWTPFYSQAYQKNTKVTPSWLHPSASRWFSLLPSPSLSVACYPLYHEDIFEKRNVHECLQCPPHWNTWGKVSSLTLWSIPAPQLEPQRRVPLLMRIFVFYMKGNFPHEGSLGRIGITLIWLVGRLPLKIYNQILFGVSELGMV